MNFKYFYAFIVTEDLLFGALERVDGLGLKLLQIIPGAMQAGSPLAIQNGKPQVQIVYKLLCRCEVSAWPDVEIKLKAIAAMGAKAFMGETSKAAS